jgi:hypothetical protein
MAEINLISGANWPKGIQGLRVDSVLPHYGFIPTDEQMEAVSERQLHGSLDVTINHRDATQVSDALGLSKDLIDHQANMFKFFANHAGVDLAVLDVEPRSFDIRTLEAAEARLATAEATANQAANDLATAEARRWLEVVGYESVVVGSEVNTDGVEVPVYESQAVYGWVGPDASEVAACQANLERAEAEVGAARGEVTRLTNEMNATIAFNEDLLQRQDGIRDKIFAGLSEEKPQNPGIARVTLDLFRANEGWRKFLNNNWMNDFRETFKKIMDGIPT